MDSPVITVQSDKSSSLNFGQLATNEATSVKGFDFLLSFTTKQLSMLTTISH